MGIEGISNYIKKAKIRMTLPQLNKLIIEDSSMCKIAIDVGYVLMAHYSATWSSATADGKIIITKEYLIRSVTESLESFNQSLKKSGFFGIWCFEGDRNTDKLATGKRETAKNTVALRRDAVLTYVTCKNLIGDNIMLQDILKRYSIIEEIVPQYDIAAELELQKNYKQDIEYQLNRLKILFRDVQIRPREVMDAIYAKLKSFPSIRVPSISEAEKVASILNIIGYCQAVYSVDSDTLVHGAKCLVRPVLEHGFKQPGTGTEKLYEVIFRDKFMEAAQESFDEINKDKERHIFDYKTLLMLSIVTGNDFNIKFGRFSPHEAEKISMAFARNQNYQDKKSGLVYENIYDYSAKKCGFYNPAICIECLCVSEKEIIDVIEVLN
jgi:hypothetical protein